MTNKKMNKKQLTAMVLATVMTVGNFAYTYADSDVGVDRNVKYTTSTDKDGIKDPNFTHYDGMNHTSQCGEKIYDTKLTIGDLNKGMDDLVSNDKKLNQDIKNEAKARQDADAAEAKARQDGDIVSGSVNNNKLTLVKGDNSTVDIDVSGIQGKDTYVESGTYNSDDQKITLRRNDGTDVDVQLDNVAKASDLNTVKDNVTNIDNRVTKVEGDVTNIDNRVTKVEGDVTSIDNRVTTVEGNVNDLTQRVTNNENNITNLQGDVTNIKNDVTNVKNDVKNLGDRVTKVEGQDIVKGELTDNKLTLTKKDNTTVTVDGVAAKADVDAEATTRADADAKLDQAIKSEATTRASEDVKLDTKISNEAKARQDGDTKLDHMISQETKDRIAQDMVLQGQDIKSARMEGNTLILERNNTEQLSVDGIANTGDIDNLQTQVTNNYNQIQQNTTNIHNEANERRQEDARLDQRIDAMHQDLAGITSRISSLEDRVNKVGALAIAHASLKPLTTYDYRYKWSGAFGTGHYKGANALAFGLFYQPNEDVLVNLSVSNCSGETGVGAGVTFRIK